MMIDLKGKKDLKYKARLKNPELREVAEMQESF